MSQEALILGHLKAGNEITSLEGVQLFNCIRTAARIKELIDAGYDIKWRWAYKVDENGKIEKRWKVWWLS